ncbi:hypothetical protein D3C79_925270 [compost metagenome]
MSTDLTHSPDGEPMHVDFDLNQNDSDALLRHCRTFIPCSGDAREDRRLADALELLAEALDAAQRPKHD